MNNKKTDQQFNLDAKDLNLLKYFILIFALSQIGAIVTESLVNSVTGTIIKYSGLILLLIVIFTLSSKYPFLNSSKRVIILFIMAMIMDLGLAVFFYIYPLLNLNNTRSILEFCLNAPNNFSLYLLIVTIFFIVIGILILLASYFLAEWSDLKLPAFKQTRVFFYYGLIFLIGQIVIGTGILITGIVFSNIEKRTYINPGDINSINSALLIVNIGFFILLIALIVEIISCFIFYFRMNQFQKEVLDKNTSVN